MNFTNGVNSPGIFHKFRSLSELKDESKGGYMEGEFNVPQGTQTITLGLYFISILIILYKSSFFLFKSFRCSRPMGG